MSSHDVQHRRTILTHLRVLSRRAASIACLRVLSRPAAFCGLYDSLPAWLSALDPNATRLIVRTYFGRRVRSFTGYRASALSYLWRMLERPDTDPAVRRAAVSSLAEFHTDAAVPCVALRDDASYDPTSQINRVIALAMFEPLGAERVAAFLRNAKGKNGHVRARLFFVMS